MVVKTLVVSLAAALLGPTLGIATFFLANAIVLSQSPPPFAQDPRVMSFAPADLWSGSQAQQGNLDTAAADLATEQGDWQTVVKCPDGQPLSGGDSCPSRTPRT
jgi:hypothetical protein